MDKNFLEIKLTLKWMNHFKMVDAVKRRMKNVCLEVLFPQISLQCPPLIRPMYHL